MPQARRPRSARGGVHGREAGAIWTRTRSTRRVGVVGGGARVPPPAAARARARVRIARSGAAYRRQLASRKLLIGGGKSGRVADAELRLASAAARVRSRGVPIVDVQVVEATDTAEAIVAAVRDCLVELVAMSTKGTGGLRRLVLGSVAEGVVRASEIPVVADPSGTRCSASADMIVCASERRSLTRRARPPPPVR